MKKNLNALLLLSALVIFTASCQSADKTGDCTVTKSKSCCSSKKDAHNGSKDKDCTSSADATTTTTTTSTGK